MCPKTDRVDQPEPIDEGAARLELNLTMTQSVYQGGEPVMCTLTLVNAGEASALINARMLLDLPLLEGEIYFVIRDRTGHTYAYTYVVVPRPVSASDFIQLPPGDDWTEDYDLHELFGLRTGHSFTAQAFYRNEFDHPNREVHAWTGKVGSNLVEFATA